MTKTLWLTDIHLDHLRNSVTASKTFGEYLQAEQEFDQVVITGDIAEAHTFKSRLNALAEGINKPIYFVLGNHDHYRGSIVDVEMGMYEGLAPNLTWLDGAALPILLDDTKALVGKYCWYDGVYGNGYKSQVVLHDFTSVAEFRARYNRYDWAYEADKGGRTTLIGYLRELAKSQAEQARKKLEDALALRPHVIFATHVPPFKGACWHEGSLSDSDWMPWFTSEACGSMLEEVAAQHPDKKILVLCGHTHSAGMYQHSANLLVRTGKAVYGAPDVAGLLFDPFAGW